MQDNIETLSAQDRLILINQFKILESLYPDEAEYYSKHRIALERGYTLHYNSMVDNLSEELPRKECEFVIEVLNMYRAITFSYRALPEEERFEHDMLIFGGFDGNEETAYMGYARYFLQDLGRFDELKDPKQYSDLNSHQRRKGRYEAMIREWTKLDRSFKLDRSQIRSILEAKQ